MKYFIRIMARQIFEFLICFFLISVMNSCSLKKEEPKPDPRETLLRYRHLLTDLKLQEAYAMLADTCKTFISEEEFIAYNNVPDSIRISQIYNMLSVDTLPVYGYNDFTRFKVRYYMVNRRENTSSDGNWFYSLVYENDQWKIIWFSKMIDIAFSHLQNQQYQQARLLFEIITGVNPFNESAFRGLAISYANLSQLDKAINTGRKMIEVIPENHSNYALLADFYRSANLLDESIENYKKAISIDSLPIYYVNLGSVYKLNKQYVEADELYRKGLELDSTLVQGWWMLGELYYQNMEDSESAERYFKKALELPPMDDTYQSQLYYSYALFLFTEAAKVERQDYIIESRRLLIEAKKYISKAQEIDSLNSDYSYLQNEINIKLQGV